MESIFAVKIPQMIKVWPDLGQRVGLGRQASYALADSMPEDIKIRMGRRIRLNAERLAAWLEAGGQGRS